MVVNGGMLLYKTLANEGALANIFYTTTTYGFQAAALAATAAQWLLNVALDANPIGLVVLAIAALVGGFILAYDNIKWFRDGVNTIMTDVENIVIGNINNIITGINLLIGAYDAIAGLVGGPTVGKLQTLTLAGQAIQAGNSSVNNSTGSGSTGGTTVRGGGTARQAFASGGIFTEPTDLRRR